MAKFSAFFVIFQKMALKTPVSVRPPKRTSFWAPLGGGPNSIVPRLWAWRAPLPPGGRLAQKWGKKGGFSQPSGFLLDLYRTPLKKYRFSPELGGLWIVSLHRRYTILFFRFSRKPIVLIPDLVPELTSGPKIGLFEPKRTSVTAQ